MAKINFVGTLNPTVSTVPVVLTEHIAYDYNTETKLGQENTKTTVSLKEKILSLGTKIEEVKTLAESAKSTALDSSTLALAALEQAEYAADDALAASKKAAAAEERVSAINTKLEDLTNNGLAEDGTVNAAYVAAIAVQSLANADTLATITPIVESIKEAFGTEEEGLLKDVAELKAGAGNKIKDVLVKKQADREAVSALDLTTGIATIDLSLINSTIKTQGEKLSTAVDDIQNLKTTRGITGIKVVSSGKTEDAEVTEGVATINLGEMVGKELDPIFEAEKTNFVNKADLATLTTAQEKHLAFRLLTAYMQDVLDEILSIRDSIDNADIEEGVTVESIANLSNQILEAKASFENIFESMTEQKYKDLYADSPMLNVLYLIEEEELSLELKLSRAKELGYSEETLNWITSSVLLDITYKQLLDELNSRILEIAREEYPDISSIREVNDTFVVKNTSDKKYDINNNGTIGGPESSRFTHLYAYLYYNGPEPNISI